MARPLPALVIVALLGLFALACDDGPPPDPVADEPPPDPVAEEPVPDPVADEEYLAVMCVNLDRFSDAVMEATEESEIAEVIEDFIEELEAVEPPADLREFHEAFIQYLEEAVDDPTSPLVLAPPLPDDDVRERLADKERSVEECREPTFFSGLQADQ